MSNTGPITIRELAEMFYAMQQEQDAAAAEAEAAGVDPAALPPMLTGEQQNFAGAIPMNDLEDDPYSLTQQLNQMQDVTDLLADPMFQAGGGVGGWSPEAFQPIVTWEQVDSPEYYRYRNYQNTPDSFEGMVAAELDGGGTPLSALRKIQAKIAENPEGAVAKQLLMFFPANIQGEPTGEIDWTLASQAATKIDEDRSKIPEIGPGTPVVAPDGSIVPGAGEIVEVDGRLLRRIETPSPMMEKFQEQGLPSPFEEYTPEMIMGPEWAAQNEEFAAMQGPIDALTEQMHSAYQDYLNYEPSGVTQEGDWSEWTGGGEEEGSGDGGPVGDWGTVAQPYEDYRNPESAYVVPPIDITEDVPQQLEEAFANGTEGQWMAWNWPTLSQHDQTNVREVLTQHNVHPQDFGYELGPPPSEPSAEEQIGLATPGGIPETESGYLPGAAAQTLEGLIVGGEGPAAWLAGNYDRLTPGERSEVDAKLQEYGLNASDYGVGGAEVQGYMGAQTLGKPDPRLPAGRVAARLGEEPAAAIQDAMWDALTRENQPEPPGDIAGPPAPGRSQPGPFPPNYPREVGGYNFIQTPDDPRIIQAIFGQLPTPPEPEGGAADQFYQNIIDTLGPQAQAPEYANIQEWEAAQGQPSPERVQRNRAMLDYMLSSILPTTPATRRAGELEDEAVRRGQEIREQSIWEQNRPEGGYATLEEAAAAGSPAAQRYLEETGYVTPPFVADEDYAAPPGGFPNLTLAAQAGSPAAIDYLEEHGAGPINRHLRPTRHPEAPYGGEAYDQMLAESRRRSEMSAAGRAAMEDLLARPGETEAGEAVAPNQIAQYLTNAEARPRRSGQRDYYQGYDVLAGMHTGEHVRRTDEDRQRLAEERAPRGLQGEEYEVTTNAGGGLGLGRRNAWKQAYRRRSHALTERNRYRDQLYGAEFGRAMRAVRNAQLSGATPLQQVYAQRMSNILNAGIPLGNQPQVIQY